MTETVELLRTEHGDAGHALAAVPAAEQTLTVLLGGSETIEYRSTVAQPITQLWRERGRPTVIFRHQRRVGAERIAELIAFDNTHRALNDPIHLNPHQPAGISNQAAVDAGADICLAFLKHGDPDPTTRDLIRRAKAAGIPVIETWEAAIP